RNRACANGRSRRWTNPGVRADAPRAAAAPIRPASRQTRPTIARPRARQKTTNVFDTIERVAKLVQNAVIILGIFGGVFSLLHAQYDRRVDRTLSFTKDYTSSVRKSYLTLVAAWNNYAEKENFFQKDEAGQKQLLAQFFSEDQGREQSFEDVADFYD